jgi:hypothetical protein
MIRMIVAAAALTGAFAAWPETASAQSFHGTCPQVYRRGPIMTATCINAFGGLNTTSINVYSCHPGGIVNVNGQLTCDGGGGYEEEDYAPPPAPYYPQPYYRARPPGFGYAPTGPAYGDGGGYRQPAAPQQAFRPPAGQPGLRPPQGGQRPGGGAPTLAPPRTAQAPSNGAPGLH